jgi:glycosyltransferase involved in cell wall biosynthesis
MKIIMLSNFFSPRIGGVEKVVERLCEELKGHEVTIVTEKHEESLKDVEKFNEWTTVHRLEYPKKKYIGLLYIWKWMFVNRKLIKNTDLIHIHDVFIWYLPFRFLFPFKPVYMTYHGWEGKLPVPISSLIQKKLAYYLTKGTICVGAYLEKYYGIKAIQISYGGTDIPKKLTKKTSNSFVYVGRLSEDTGLSIILQSLEKLENYTIEFCGDGPLKSQCEKYGRVHGFVKDPSPYLAKAEFCLAGGFLTILESFANKCLVLVCYQNEIKEDYFKMAPFAKYMVIEGSPKKLSKKIHYYKTHKREKEKLVESAYNWVKDQSWENVADQYRQLWGINN